MTLGMHLAQVIEDDRAVQKVLSMMLEDDGFRVTLSDNCARGEIETPRRHDRGSGTP